MVARVAFLNAENDRLKSIIVDYEERFAKALSSKRSLSHCTEYSEDSHIEDLAFSRSPKDRRQTEKSLLADARATISLLEARVQQLTADNNRLAGENQQLRKKQEAALENEYLRFSSEASQGDFSTTQVRELREEVKVLREALRSLSEEKKRLITEETLFEKLKEQELYLISTFRLSEKSTSDESRLLKQYENSIKKLTAQNKQLQAALKEKNEGRALRPLSLSEISNLSPEHEARKHMLGLERKITDLIRENEIILQENQELKDLSLSIINTTRKSNQRLTMDNQGSNSSRKQSDYNISVKEEPLTSRDKEMLEVLQLVEQKYGKENSDLKWRISELERELDETKECKVRETIAKPDSYRKPLEWSDLEEANAVIIRLDKENRLLMKRIEQLEATASDHQQETDQLYTILESKTKAQTDQLRERSIGWAHESYIDIGGLS